MENSIIEGVDIFFEHNYARSTKNHRVVYIEYVDDRPFNVITEVNGIQHHFDFEMECYGGDSFMFYHSGSGGRITDIQAPHFVKGANASYWMHPSAKFKGGKKAKNAVKLEKPIEYREGANPFDNGREIYAQDYCKFCEKWYDQDACPEHHRINEQGELEYYDGTPASD